MKLGIMQPYFFPYIGYFALINYVDKWIAFDTVQYIYHGWINRNRILKPNRQDWQYVVVPLQKHSRNTLIKNTVISENKDWKERILRQLEHYKKIAPFYEQTMELVNESLSINEDFISKLNLHILSKILEKLEIEFKFEIFSEMNTQLDDVKEPGEWALKISQKLNADEYVNPVGGIEIFDKQKFVREGIKLSFLDIDKIEYNQFNKNFIPNLSIIDVLMFNGPYNTRNLLNHIVISD